MPSMVQLKGCIDFRNSAFSFQFFDKRMTVSVEHTPSTPNIGLRNIFLFPKLKINPNGQIWGHGGL